MKTFFTFILFLWLRLNRNHQPLVANDASGDDPLYCHFSFEAIELPSDLVMFMPGGVHDITPSQGGKPVKVKVVVDAQSAMAMERQRQALAAKGQRPYFDFNHEDREASFWPDEFFWSESPRPAIYARGERTDMGDAGIKGKRWRGFSPVFHVDNPRANPARIVAREFAKPNMGGLVNDPAFKSILPFWAKNAVGAQSNNQPNQPNEMTPEELAALQAKNKQLEKDIAELRQKEQALKAKNETDAIVAAELRAKEAELKAGKAEESAAALEAKNKTLETAATARAEKDADEAVEAAVKRGAISAKDEDGKKSWKALIVADPANAALLAKTAGNPALENKRVTDPAIKAKNGESHVVITAESANAVMKEYGSILAKNAALPLSVETAKEKGTLAREAAELFAKDISDNKVIVGMPIDDAIKAADFSDPNNNVGLLSGTLVLQRALPLMQHEYPAMTAVSTDFSDTPGVLNQSEVAHIVLKPAVQTYDPSPDASGRPKGWITVSPAQTVDVPIKLDEYVGVPIVFGQATLASTVRNLFGEVAPQALYALGGHFMSKLAALWTPENYNAYRGTTVNGGETTDDSATIVVASTAAMYPGQPITGAGIPAYSFVKSITDATHAVLNNAATATAAGLTFTLGTDKVPQTYTTFAQALADFSLASLDEIGAAFDTNEVPSQDRFAALIPRYYRRLGSDPSLNRFFAAMQSPEIITKGRLPELEGFMPYKAGFMPTSGNRVGFAGHKAAALIKSRLPMSLFSAVGAQAPGSVTTVTDPVSGLSVLLVQYINLQGNFAEWRPEVLLGAAVGERRAGLVLTSQ